MEAKLDDILTSIRQLDRKLDSVDNTVKGIQEDLRSFKFDVAQHDDKIRVLEEQMGQLRCSNNTLQQQQRSLTLRLFNANLGPESDDIKGRVYECLKPVLAAAKAAKDLTSLPQVASVIEACFRPPSSDPNVSPPIIIKVPNKSIKIALLKHKSIFPNQWLAQAPSQDPNFSWSRTLPPTRTASSTSWSSLRKWARSGPSRARSSSLCPTRRGSAPLPQFTINWRTLSNPEFT